MWFSQPIMAKSEMWITFPQNGKIWLLDVLSSFLSHPTKVYALLHSLFLLLHAILHSLLHVLFRYAVLVPFLCIVVPLGLFVPVLFILSLSAPFPRLAHPLPSLLPHVWFCLTGLCGLPCTFQFFFSSGPDMFSSERGFITWIMLFILALFSKISTPPSPPCFPLVFQIYWYQLHNTHSFSGISNICHSMSVFGLNFFTNFTHKLTHFPLLHSCIRLGPYIPLFHECICVCLYLLCAWGRRREKERQKNTHLCTILTRWISVAGSHHSIYTILLDTFLNQPATWCLHSLYRKCP